MTRADDWLADAIHDVRIDPATIDDLFPVAGRQCGRDVLPDGRRVDDAARLLLLQALPIDGAALLDVLWRLYRFGDAAERRAILLALPQIDQSGIAVPIVQDALRTNDKRLIEAAIGDYATRHLADHDFRQGVLKCVFVGIPLAHVPGLPERLDAELAHMLGRYAEERQAAHRTVPTDVAEIIEEWL